MGTLRGKFKQAVIMIVLVLMSACASQRFYQDGKNLIEQGKYTEGFKLLKQATEASPDNTEYKKYYYRQKENWVNKLLREADTDRVNESWQPAEQKYQDVLAVEPENVRAKEGLNAIELGKISSDLLKQVDGQIKQEDYIGATTTLKQLLARDPLNSKAKLLLTRVQQKRNPDNVIQTVVQSKFKKPVSLEFKGAPIRTVFELLSRSAGVNFILDKEIRNDTTVSVFVKNTTINDALNNILATAQLSKKILNENSVLIYPNAKRGDYEELVAKTFYLHNADPKKVVELVKTVVGSKDIFVDENLKMLVMRDTARAVEMADKLIQAYDLNDPEVLLEVEVLEVSSDKLNEIGLRFPSQLTFGVVGAGGTAGSLSLNEAKNFNSNLGRVTITDPALILNLRGTEGSSNVLANPHIRVRNHKKAKVHIGDRVPVITNTATSTGFLSESISYLDVGLKLDVEPTILVNDDVAIDVSLEVSNIINEVISKSGSLSYRIGTRNASTSLQLKNGETQILAGLISSEERSSAEKVPGIGSLPIIGRLFSSKRETNAKTEIVLLITPKIVRNIIQPEPTYTEFSLGTESGNLPASMSGMQNGANASTIQSIQQDNYQNQQNLPPNNPAIIPMEPLQPAPLNIPPPPPLPNPPVLNQAAPSVGGHPQPAVEAQ